LTAPCQTYAQLEVCKKHAEGSSAFHLINAVIVEVESRENAARGLVRFANRELAHIPDTLSRLWTQIGFWPTIVRSIPD
jgi:hypothetical protein